MKRAEPLHRYDLSNRSLFSIVSICLLGGLFLSIVTSSFPGVWGAPGGPILQTAAALGAFLLTASFASVMAKRFGYQGKLGFRLHVWLASAGSSLVIAHSLQNLGRTPALLLVLLVGLVALGLWSRTKGAHLAAITFGEKRGGFANPNFKTRERLKEIIQAKKLLLQHIEPTALESIFSPRFRHYLRTPVKTIRYKRLASLEERLTGARTGLPLSQAFWRFAHKLLAWGFIIGLLLHVLIVMFFAKYAAGGDEPYWFHFLALDF